MLSRFLKAEYVFRPSQLLRRLTPNTPREGLVETRFPWGHTIRVSSRDNIGPQVLQLGVYDLIVTETIWRLCDPEATTVDVGANVGCMTAAMAERVGAGGIVHSFEPHPILFAELSANCSLLREQGVAAGLEPHQMALGDAAGELPLNIPADFELHRGESTLSPEAPSMTSNIIQVRVETLDRLFPHPTKIDLMKVDVEGFEMQVFSGAANLLKEKRVKHCVFEEHRPYPSDVTRCFEDNGYSVFRLERALLHPRLLPGNSPRPRSTWEATSFLATLQPANVIARLGHFGWRCLRG